MCCKKSTTQSRIRDFILVSIAILPAAAVPEATAQSRATAIDQAVGSANEIGATWPVAIDGTVIQVDGVPFFARLIQHNGETFEFLRSVGFNTIQLPATATQTQLDQARRLGIWLVCPPPASVGLEKIPYTFDPVIAWSVGEKATGRNLQNILQTVREVRESDRRRRRPVMANLDSHWQSTGSSVDILSIGKNAIGSSFVPGEYSEWIGQTIGRQVKPVWIDLPTQLSPGLERQIEAMATAAVPPIDHQQLKFLMYEAVSGGARGLRFLSHTRLDAEDPSTRLRVLGIRWLLRHVDQIQLWAAAGLAERIDVSASRDFDVHSIRLSDSSLLLIQRTTGVKPVGTVNAALKPIDFRVPTSSVSDQVFLVDEAGTTQLPNARSNTGVRINMRACPDLACVLVTGNPSLISQINNSPGQIAGAPGSLDLAIELTRQALAISQLVQQQLAAEGQNFPFVDAAISEAEIGWRNAGQMRSAGSPAIARQYLNQADSRLAFMRQKLRDTVADDDRQFVTSPLLQQSTMIPMHQRMSRQLAVSNWTPNSLTGGDFEDLQRMKDAGWINRREDLATLNTKVELSRQAAVEGTYGLKLSVTGADEFATASVQTPPVWVQSASVTVSQGQWICIQGYVNVPREISGSHDGLLITDSLGGPDLASRIRKTDGWQPFTLYRSATKNGMAHVTFALTGYGQAMIDEVTVRIITAQTPAAQAVQLREPQTSWNR